MNSLKPNPSACAVQDAPALSTPSKQNALRPDTSDVRRALVYAAAERRLPASRGQRQAEVLALAAVGNTDLQSAERLGVSKETVGEHWSRLFERLGVACRTEAVALVLEAEIAALRQELSR